MRTRSGLMVRERRSDWIKWWLIRENGNYMRSESNAEVKGFEHFAIPPYVCVQRVVRRRCYVSADVRPAVQSGCILRVFVLLVMLCNYSDVLHEVAEYRRKYAVMHIATHRWLDVHCKTNRGKLVCISFSVAWVIKQFPQKSPSGTSGMI